VVLGANGLRANGARSDGFATIRAMSGRVSAISLAASLVLGFGVAAAPAAAHPRAPLGHAGRWITDAEGRVVILHGVNMVYKVPPYAPDAAGFGADDAAFLEAHGFNSVRLGVLHVGVEPQPGIYDDGYLSRIAATVRILGQHGIYSLLDFHQDLYNEAFQGEGEPAWSVQDDGLPAAPMAGFPGNYVVMPALERAFDHFWANSPGPGGPGLQDRYVAAWQHVASYFRGNPYVMGDDLFNEPWPGSQWPTCASPAGCPVFDQTVLAPFMHRLILAIHAVNPSVVTYYEPNVLFDFGSDTQIGKPGDAQSGMSFHDYCVAGNLGMPQSGLGGTGCDSAESLVFRHADFQAQRTGDALLLSEFGATDDLTVIERIVTEADQAMVGWDYWAYCGCQDPTGSPTEPLVNDPSHPPAGSNVRWQKLAVLERPYPQAVAGTLTGFSYDPTADIFQLSYSTARASGAGRFAAGSETDVYVPALHYPRRYSVRVTGAAAISKPGAPILRLASCARRRIVTVRVAPNGRSSSDCRAPAVARMRSGGRRGSRHTIVHSGRPRRSGVPGFTG
jgi:endoglycosylceramidase